MTKFLLSVHVLAAILVVGPIAVAASLFPRYARQSASGGGDSGERDAGVAVLLHRICRSYAVVGVAVPVFGIATGAQLGVLTDAWLLVSMLLTALAAALLVLAIVPGQRRMLAPVAGVEGAGDGGGTGVAVRPAAARLAMLTGVFNILWAIVVVLMIVRPGSTTGA
ncbi:hypothetical protein CUT44_30985 [Streptomyces carminius]|uniref:DUF2269 domain-containing protein n=1 Tax=Streptomyces carminius TaxID=2665496 RepID=A0A2M8LPX3_9ACTN|nr:hypothetical protein [Streptomyces carminius]PJE93972.1 hypothetical protein CUT44_30985 [Streptomyces carminius]